MYDLSFMTDVKNTEKYYKKDHFNAIAIGGILCD